MNKQENTKTLVAAKTEAQLDNAVEKALTKERAALAMMLRQLGADCFHEEDYVAADSYYNAARLIRDRQEKAYLND